MAITTASTGAAATAAAAGTRSQQAGTKLADSFDSFLKLLTTQLSHQDPLSPMDATQFTDQLVKFSTIEQAIESNSHLERLTSLLEADGLTSALGFIGMEASFTPDQVRLDATGGATLSYRLPKDAAAVTVTVRDARGAVVHEAAGGPAAAGDRSFAWDGRGVGGGRQAAGLYRVEVKATDAAGGSIAVAPLARGPVEGVETGSGGMRLLVGGVPVALDQVTSVVRPAAAATAG